MATAVDDESGNGSSIADFYAGRSIFITGATGFMGKVLVEKLLRSCPGVKCLYLLMRPTATKDIECRRLELVNNPVFTWLRENQPELMDKIVPVAGDVTLPGFGISPDDLQTLLDNVSIVFNSAATVRFDEELKEALQTNVKGPRQLLAMARQMKHLEAFVHVSTVFNNLHREEIEEVVYPGRIDPVKLIEFLDCIDSETIKSITPQIIGKDPNTYTFTKALAEQLLEKECGNVPLVIVRPSVVTASAQEPMAGWIDNIYGPTGVIAGGGKGFLRIFRCVPDLMIDIIPVDYSINLMLAAGWHTAVQKPSQIGVYNGSSSYHNPITFGEMKEYSIDGWIKYPAWEVMWCPSCETTNNSWYFRINVAISHYVPAYIFDLLSRLRGKRGKLVNIYDRVFNALTSLDFFYTRQWRFISQNPDKLWSTMSANDKKTFYFDVRQIDWRSYFEKYVRGVRLYILKEDPKTLPEARKNLVKMYLFKIFVRTTLVMLFVWSITRNKRQLFKFK